MIQLHITYTMKTGIHPKAFFDALNAANIPSLCRHEKGNIRYSYYLPADNDNQLFLLEIWKSYSLFQLAMTAEPLNQHGLPLYIQFL